MDKLQAGLIAGGAVAAATLVGARHGPQHPRTAVWYFSLRKPRFTPPGPVIGAVWTALDVLLAISGTRVMVAPSSPMRSAALGFWSLNLAGIAGYPWVFFGRKRLGASIAVSGAMLVSATSYVATAAQVDRKAAAMGVPLAVWVGLATLLSEELWRRNR